MASESIQYVPNASPIVAVVPANGINVLLDCGDDPRKDIPVQAWVFRADGTAAGWLPVFGYLDDREDFLGYKSEPCPCGTSFQYDD